MEVLLLGAAALFAGLADLSPTQLSAYALIATLSFAMDLRNTMVRRVGSPNLATTVLNLTLTPVATLPGAAGALLEADIVLPLALAPRRTGQ